MREPVAFALAGVGVGEDGLSVAWSPELEISARRLWQLANEQSSDSRAEFRDWLQRNQLTLTGMASAPPLIMNLAMPVPLTSILSRKRARKRTNRCASFTLTTAAEALGLTRRTISQYSSGARPLPKTVHLALKGFEAERQAA